MALCSVVIRCYNEEKYIGKLLESILQQTVTDCEIVIVDSGSTDRTLSIVQQYPARIVQIAPHEFTFGRALNRGIAAARGKYILIVSAHVYPTHNDWIEKMLAPFAADKRVALSFGRQIGNQITKYSEHQIFRKWFPPEPHWYLQDHPFCNNANACIRRDVWEQLPYDEQLTGLEDLDWAKKALQKGYLLAYVPEAPIVHIHEETPQRILNRYRREAIAYKRIFPEAHFSLWDLLYLFSTNVISDWYHAWQEGVWSKNWREIVVFRLMQFWGTYQGYRQRGEVSEMLKRRFYYPNKLKR
ncbi:MAG: glycosyltransferase [Cytophagales bacterium]|nr:glycosyltransferase [Bernardetiaceae bacterium]MDW8203851.1 glycosyltransferase [Cytophagales bacterium]